jgi:hypothetical protein
MKNIHNFSNIVFLLKSFYLKAFRHKIN